MNRVVLDASAFLALMNEEKGHEIVASILEHSVISTVNMCEVIAELHDKLTMPLDEAEGLLLTLVPEIIDFDLDQSVTAASLQLQTKEFGLSLGDRACLALGKKLNAPVYTADKIWSKVNLDIEIVVIR
jgi:PIN domain nuclease of toxin-antitoxin system